MLLVFEPFRFIRIHDLRFPENGDSNTVFIIISSFYIIFAMLFMQLRGLSRADIATFDHSFDFALFVGSVKNVADFFLVKAGFLHEGGCINAFL